MLCGGLTNGACMVFGRFRQEPLQGVIRAFLHHGAIRQVPDTVPHGNDDAPLGRFPVPPELDGL